MLRYKFVFFALNILGPVFTSLTTFSASNLLAAKNVSSFEIGGQKAWVHDEGNPAGYFHTYDNFNVAKRNETPRKIHVFLPKNYEETQERFPVVYMNNGDIAFFSNSLFGHADNLKTSEAISKMNEMGRNHQPIIVAIYPLNPEEEYTFNKHNQNCCSVVNYANYVADHVKRFIDNNYKTLKEPENTTVLGVSLGANAAILQAFLRPDAFLNVAAISPPIWRETNELQFTTSNFAKTLEYSLPQNSQKMKMYLDWGNASPSENTSFDKGTEEQRTAYSANFFKDYLVKNYNFEEGKNLSWQEDTTGYGTIENWSQRLVFALSAFVKWR
jgi:predicted alpha/beta superfamily hydrolase